MSELLTKNVFLKVVKTGVSVESKALVLSQWAERATRVGVIDMAIGLVNRVANKTSQSGCIGESRASAA